MFVLREIVKHLFPRGDEVFAVFSASPKPAAVHLVQGTPQNHNTRIA